MKNIRKYLSVCAMTGLVGAGPIMASENQELSQFDIAAANPTTLNVLVSAHDQNILTSEEVHYFVNNMTFFADISNDCEAEKGKCKYYLIPNVTGQGLGNSGTNINLFKSNDRFNAIKEIYDVYQYILDQNDSGELIKIENRIKALEITKKIRRLTKKELEDLELELAQLEEERRLIAEGISEEVKASFETYLRYTLPNVGISVDPTETYEELLDHLQDLRKQKVGQANLYINVGFSKKAVEIVTKVTKLLKMVNPDATITYSKSAQPISVKAAYSQADSGNIFDDDLYEKYNFMQVRPGTTLSPNGGTVILDLNYDGVLELQRMATSNTAMSFPLDFIYKYEWDFEAHASVSCVYKKRYKEIMTQKMETTHKGEKAYLAVPSPSREAAASNSEIFDCKRDDGKVISDVLKAKISKIEDDARQSLKDAENEALSQYTTWANMANGMSALNGKEIFGEKRFKKFRNFQQKCQVVTLSSSSSSLFGIFSDSNSRAQKICWEEYQDVIKEFYAPVEVSYINKSVFEQHINKEINYTFNGPDTIIREVSPNFSFCTKLSMNNVGDVTGSNCDIQEHLDSLVGEK